MLRNKEVKKESDPKKAEGDSIFSGNVDVDVPESLDDLKKELEGILISIHREQEKGRKERNKFYWNAW